MVSSTNWTEGLLGEDVSSESMDLGDDSWTNDLLPEEPKPEPVVEPKVNLKKKDISYLDNPDFKNTIQGRMFREFMKPGSEPELTKPIIKKESIQKEVDSWVSGLSDFFEDTPTHSRFAALLPAPLRKTVRATGDFFGAIPGFVLGMLALPDRAKVMLGKKDASVEDLFNTMEGDIEEINSAVRTHITDQTLGTLVGESTPGSETVTRAIMLPLEVLTRTANSISDWKRFEDSPNVRGVIKFAGFGAGIVAMGKLYHGSEKTKAFDDIADIVTKTKDLETKYKMVDEIPDEAIKAAQEKILDAQKVQLELQAKEMMDKLDYGSMIKEDLSSKTKQIKQIKQANKYIADEVINKAFEKLPEAKVEKPKVEVAKVEEFPGEVLATPKGTINPALNVRYDGPWEGIGESWTEMETKSSFITKTKNFDEVMKGRDEVIKRYDEANKFVSKAEDETIREIENEFQRPIDKITDEEIEGYYDRKFAEEPDTEIDMEIQEREPFQLDTEHSPFREDLSVAEGRAEAFAKTKGVQNDPELFTAKLINDVNLWLGGKEVPIDQVREGLSQFASRAEEIRDYFRESEDYPSNFDNWKEMVSEAASWARKAKREGDSGVKLYDIGGAVGEGAKQIIEGAKRAKAYIENARGLKKFKPVEAAKMLKEELKRNFIDRSGNIRTSLIDELGDVGYGIIQKMYLSKGASSRSASMLKQMQKEVYRGLNGREKRILDTLIFHNRMVDLGKYKTPKQFKYFKEHPVDESIAYVELLGQIEKLTPEQVADMHNRAKAYFDWMKQPLKDMLESGLISQEEFNALSEHNYRKLKLVDIFDKRYQSKIGKKKRTVYDSGVQSLARGKDTDIFEPSSEVMALEVFNRAYGRIFNNEANKTLLELARQDKENPFVRVKDSPNDSIPGGWDRIFVYDKGERKSLYLSPELSKEWITNNPEMSYKMSQLVRYASGSQVLRTFATGINWGFALANVPRDVMHTWFTARSWQDGKWKPIYSPHAPVFPLQITRDLATVFNDALLRKGRYEDYINQGGGMEFMVHQGRILQRGRHLEGPLDKVENFLGFFGETSEILTRLAIRERALRQGKSPQEATFIARDYMDFGQGGSIAKALDNGIPYLNASIQGTRGLIRSFKDNPVESSYKLAQFGALVTGIYIAMYSRSPETKKNLQGSLDMTNNIVIPLGDEFGFLDSQGQQRYPYIKIPLDPSQRFFKKFFEASTDKWLGNEVDVEGTAEALKQLSPVDISALPPTVSGTLGYISNKDFWRNEDIWKESEPFSYPNSSQEFTGRTPQAFVDVGKVTGLSPERLKYAVGELVTNGTVWSYLLGAGYEELLGDMPKENKEQHLAMVLSQMPIAKRFIGVTNPYSKYAEKLDEAQEGKVLEEFVQNRNFDIKVDAYLYGEGVSRQDLIKEANSYKDVDVYDRLMDRLAFEEGIKKLPEKSFWRRMKGLRLEAKAQVFVDRLKNANEVEKKQLWKEYGIVSGVQGVVSEEFDEEVFRLLGEKK